jgi:hypothetical protein
MELRIAGKDPREIPARVAAQVSGECSALENCCRPNACFNGDQKVGAKNLTPYAAYRTE